MIVSVFFSIVNNYDTGSSFVCVFLKNLSDVMFDHQLVVGITVVSEWLFFFSSFFLFLLLFIYYIYK